MSTPSIGASGDITPQSLSLRSSSTDTPADNSFQTLYEDSVARKDPQNKGEAEKSEPQKEKGKDAPVKPDIPLAFAMLAQAPIPIAKLAEPIIQAIRALPQQIDSQTTTVVAVNFQDQASHAPEPMSIRIHQNVHGELNIELSTSSEMAGWLTPYLAELEGVLRKKIKKIGTVSLKSCNGENPLFDK